MGNPSVLVWFDDLIIRGRDSLFNRILFIYTNYFILSDKADEKAIHVLLKREDKLVAYTRIVPHTDQVHISFGRVLVVKEYRKHELGRKVVQATLNQIQKQFPAKEIKIQAQSYLQNFYSSFGFSPVSDVYLEDNIPHLDMILKK
ncbi:GNAT family N-acetyltransferase [Ligilactobacillus acidipiscis]|uniref:GNAT family N-acetyltransferase n=3 Tax=Ligilactobacillus acidipiscis TaxID=89059 RepID=UPI0009A8C4F1|nr:GNAT family N-acetyltransferase [Ligilactobacillus acidipiscis]